jgi:hypothetical protein
VRFPYTPEKKEGFIILLRCCAANQAANFAEVVV